MHSDLTVGLERGKTIGLFVWRAILDGKELYGNLKESWLEIVQHIDRFRSADLFLISSPMWNFSIPYMLKQYIDLIVQPKYLFRYTKTGVEGLLKGKKMVLILSRGGQYTGEQKGFDFQEPYLRTIFGFVGITDIACIKAESMDVGGPEIQREKIEEAQNAARELGMGI